jgi:hypothetical protein
LAHADQLLPLDNWPLEGRRLGEIIEQLVGPAAWSECTAATGELLSPYLRSLAKPQAVGLHAETLRPLLELWSSGALVARGRRGHPFSPPIEIPAPDIGWDLMFVDFGRSIIRDPIGEGKIYDLRFFRPNTNASALPQWCAAEIKRMKAAGEIHDSIRITKLAELLADRLGKASKAGNTSIKPVTSGHIKNMLPTWDLWPMHSIK